MNNPNLTTDQRFLIETYVNMYNSTLRQIDLLYNNLDSIRNNIENVYSIPTNANASANTNSNTNANASANANTNASASATIDSLYNFFANPPLRTNRTRNNTTRESLRNFYLPVTIRPTETQINNAIRIVSFETILNPVNSRCPISLERFTPEQEVAQIIHCGHVFNSQEITTWFNSNVRCPVCRFDIRDYIPSSSSSIRSQRRITRQPTHTIFDNEDEENNNNSNNNSNNNNNNEDTTRQETITQSSTTTTYDISSNNFMQTIDNLTSLINEDLLEINRSLLSDPSANEFVYYYNFTFQ
jgi:hypothetical protein